MEETDMLADLFRRLPSMPIQRWVDEAWKECQKQYSDEENKLDQRTLDIFRRAIDSDDHDQQMYVFLSFLNVTDAVQKFCRTACPGPKLDAFLPYLQTQFVIQLSGLDAQGNNIRTLDEDGATISPLQHMAYPTVASFVTTVTNYYLAL